MRPADGDDFEERQSLAATRRRERSWFALSLFPALGFYLPLATLIVVPIERLGDPLRRLGSLVESHLTLFCMSGLVLSVVWLMVCAWRISGWYPDREHPPRPVPRVFQTLSLAMLLALYNVLVAVLLTIPMAAMQGR
ncbi:MAG TPA: hypothetical protein VG796_02665 [Verrucomicrobiales bacterium]|jgi:hypothetical protein|nr:hypothetical protein [Verrucomicrobiales bacterium]